MTPMHNVHSSLHIGTDEDAQRLLRTTRHGPITPWQQEVAPGWAIVHAAKSPWHTDLLSYRGPAPLGHPEQWVAQRIRRTYLNLVDAPTQMPELVLPILDRAVAQIEQYLTDGLSVLVHCNMGLSRSPAVVMWWQRQHHSSYDNALAEVVADHPYTRVDSGIMRLVRERWSSPLASAEPAS